MGIGTASFSLLTKLWQTGRFSGRSSVLELGSQELHISRTVFEALIEKYNITGYRSSDFPNIDNWPNKKPRCAAKHLYRLLGLDDYKSIDLNENHDSLALDLNEPLRDTSLYGKFDVVTDFGTAEHVFVASEAYRTLHRLCSPNGLMIIFQILYPFDIHHGFYRFDPYLFRTLAEVNKYEVIESLYWIVPKTAVNEEQHLVPLDQTMLDCLDLSKILGFGEVFVFQKTSSEDFKAPYQIMQRKRNSNAPQ